MNPKQLALAIDLFESKIIKLEEDYKEKHKDNFERKKMQEYINKKLKREIKILTFYNILPSIEALETSESFKY